MIGTWTVVGIRHLTHNQVVAGSSPAGPGGMIPRKFYNINGMLHDSNSALDPYTVSEVRPNIR